MSESIRAEPTWIDARELSEGLPENLRALEFVRRAPRGPALRLYGAGDVGFCGDLADAGPEVWAEIGPLLRSGDLAFANLETPLVAGPPGSPFVAPLASAPRLGESGFRVLNLANNHIADAGPRGVASTLDAVAEQGLRAVGASTDPDAAGDLVVTEGADLRVGWLACARTLQRQETGAGFWELDREELLASVKRHRESVEVLVVSVHWGYMYVDYPDPDHRNLALDLAAAGADLVLGHHAHVVQGFEVVDAPSGRRAAVCHNLGNLLLDWRAGEASTGPEEEQRRGVVVAVDLDRESVCRLAVLPTRVDDGWVVRWAVGETGDAALDRVERISVDLAGDYESAFLRQRSERNIGPTLGMLGRRLRGGDLGTIVGLLRRLRPRHVLMLFRWIVGKLRS